MDFQNHNFPAIHPPVRCTGKGTPYLQQPGIVLLGKTEVDLSGVQPYLDGFDQELGFNRYLQDPPVATPESLLKFAGQLCYMSLGSKRTWNHDTPKYLQHIKQSGHGSVLEHINLSFLFYGISRSLTHELVRHRAGMAFSQVSQRYVDGKSLRFVERPEYRADSGMHIEFEQRIDFFAAEYKLMADMLLARQDEGVAELSAEHKTDLRKKINQCARSLLPNETEAPIVVTMNGRALRHVLEMRAAAPAETEIRKLFAGVYTVAKEVVPILLDDYAEEALLDGTVALNTPYKKV
jgi:thymidylate synthase (FAD)